MGQVRGLTSLAQSTANQTVEPWLNRGYVPISLALFLFNTITCYPAAPQQRLCLNIDVANFSPGIRVHGVLHMDQTPRWRSTSSLFRSGDLPHPSFNLIPLLGQEAHAHTHTCTHHLPRNLEAWLLTSLQFQTQTKINHTFINFLTNHIFIHLASPTFKNWFHLIYNGSASHLW